MQVDGPREGTSSRHKDAAVVAPCEQVMIGEELDLWHCCHFRLQGLDLLPLYTKRWFMNHCPVQVIRVMLRGIQLRAPILHT